MFNRSFLTAVLAFLTALMVLMAFTVSAVEAVAPAILAVGFGGAAYLVGRRL